MHPLLFNIKNILSQLELDSSLDRKIVIKEYLQNFVLNYIYNSAVYQNLVFYGGTCLRKMYNLNRFSEDLDFETTKPQDLNKLATDLETYFKSEIQYPDVYTKTQTGEFINRVTIKFPILHDVGLSDNQSEVLHVKVEVNPKARREYPTQLTPLYKDNLSMLVKHYDLPTLMAGKMLACLNRIYKKGNTNIEFKGRDYYDLIWYMQQQIMPNGARLQDDEEMLTVVEAFKRLKIRVDAINQTDLLVDLLPLFENTTFIKNWCKNFHQLFNNYLTYYL